MNWLKQHRKIILGVLLGGIVLYLLYRWYQSSQASSTTDTSAQDAAAQAAEMAAIQNALQSQGLGAAASGAIVTPSISTPASGGMVPSNPATIPDNSGQVMSTVQGSLQGASGPGAIPAVQTPDTGSGGGYGYNVPNPTGSGVGMNTAATQAYVPPTTPSYSPNNYSNNAAVPASAALTPTRASRGTVTSLPTRGSTLTRGGTAAPATPAVTRTRTTPSTLTPRGATGPTAPRTLTLATPSRAVSPSSGRIPASRASLPGGRG